MEDRLTRASFRANYRQRVSRNDQAGEVHVLCLRDHGRPCPLPDSQAQASCRNDDRELAGVQSGRVDPCEATQYRASRLGWAGWKVFLYTQEDMRRIVRYI